MRTFLFTLSILIVSFGVGLQGCTENTSHDDHDDAHDHDHDHNGDDHDHDGDDHDHAHDDHDGDDHDHAHDDHDGDDHDHDDHDGHAHPEASISGSAMAAGATIAFVIAGEVEPGAELHANLEQTDGPAIAAIRIWVGDKAATGAMKTKADLEGDDGKHFHAHVEVPASLGDDAAIWIEAQTEAGKTGTISIKVF